MTFPFPRDMVSLKTGLFALIAMGLAFTLHASPAAAQSSCQGQSKGQCESSSSCGWVSGYKTKAGASVKSYCRAKPGKGAAKKKAAKTKASAKKESGKAKATAKKAKKAKKKVAKKKKATKKKVTKKKATKKAKATKADRKAKSTAK